MVSRRKFLKTSLAAAAGLALPLAGYAQFVEPHRLTLERLELRIPNLPEAFDGFRIAQLSDLHYGTYTGAGEISAAVALANSLKPDLAVFTGDLTTAPRINLPVTHRVFTQAALCARILSGLTATHGVVGCLGNHDFFARGHYVTEVLGAAGIAVLRNSNQAIERAGQRIWIAGVDDAIFGVANFDSALARIPAKETVVLLAHEPDLADEAARRGFALQLSGHSHGGQVRLPLITPLILPELARKYPFGHYRVRNMHLYTNRGIGMIVLPYRFNAPPEVTLTTLRSH